MTKQRVKRVKAWITVQKSTGKIWAVYFDNKLKNSIDKDWDFVRCTITYRLPRKVKR